MNGRHLLTRVACCFVALLLASVYPAPIPVRRRSSQDSLFSPGDTLRQKLPPQRSCVLPLSLQPNEYLRLAVSSWDTGITVVVFDPNGTKILADPMIEENPTHLSWMSTTRGRYMIEISSGENGLAAATFEVRIEERRPARKSDKLRISAEFICREASILQKQWTPESDQKAIEKLSEAVQMSNAAGDQENVARTLCRLGDLLQDRSRFSEARARYEQSLQISERSGNSKGMAEALARIGLVQVQTLGGRRALESLERALKIGRESEDQRSMAMALTNTGEAFYMMGAQRVAAGYYQQAAQLWRKMGERRGLAMTFHSLGAAYADLSEVGNAFQHYEEALQLWRAIGDRHGEALTLTLLGTLYGNIGEHQEAINRYRQAAQFFQNGGDPLGEGSLMDKFAYAYYSLGDQQASLDYSRKALALYRKANFRQGEAAELHKIGKIQYEVGQIRVAVDYFEESLLLYQQVQDQLCQGALLYELGRVQLAMGDAKRALTNLNQSLDMFRSAEHLRGQAQTLRQLGIACQQQGDVQKAVQFFREALEFYQKAQDRFGEVETRSNLAQIYRRLGNPAEALNQIQKSVEIAESLRTKVHVPSLRVSYFSTMRKTYDLYIDILMDLHRSRPGDGWDGAALQISEGARARNLLDLLQESRAEIRLSIDPSLAGREKELLRSLNLAAQRQNQLLVGKYPQQELDKLAAHIRALETEYDQLQADIRIRNRRYAELTQPQPLGLKEIQQRVLDEETVLLEYSLGEEHSWLWAVTKSEIASHELPPQQKIETLARKVRELLTAPQVRLIGESASQRRKREVEAEALYKKSAAELSRILLGPVSHMLNNCRLLIVADGLLQYLPFAALPLPPSGNSISADLASIPLAAEHEIVNLPSASMLEVLRQQNAGRIPREMSVAVFADPVYQRDDPRLHPANKVLPGRNIPSAEPSGRSGGFPDVAADTEYKPAELSYSRLLFSSREADYIYSTLAPGSAHRWLGTEASRERAMDKEISRYKIIHFATHGEVDDLHPSLSCIVLSLYDAKGREQDGFLRLHEIYNLKLPTELVVLSACNTGLGRDIRGEGLIGLVRGFMYAGASRVLASLWRVDDESTAELMVRLYRGMMQEGLSPAASLRMAQLEMSKIDKWAAPYYWAGFVLQGEYR